jgi:hypothetical protein
MHPRSLLGKPQGTYTENNLYCHCIVSKIITRKALNTVKSIEGFLFAQ